MKIAIDISPIVINKTAISRIVRDSFQLLQNESSLKPSFYVLGIPMSPSEIGGTKFKLLQKFFFWVIRRPKRWHYLIRPLWRLFVSKWTLGAKKLLTFDPLYLTFYPSTNETVSFVLDLTPITASQWHNPNVVFLYQKAFQDLVRPKLKVLSISQSTSSDIRLNLGGTSKWVREIPLYLPEIFKNPPMISDTDKFFLYVGSLEERKNPRRLISAFNRSGLHEKGWNLKLAGGRGHGWEDIESLVQKSPGVQLLGFVSDEDLVKLYTQCHSFVFPSQWEGFGLPLLEAIAYHKRVITSLNSACPEAAGGLGIYINPQDTEEISKALVRASELEATLTPQEMAMRAELLDKFTFEKYSQVLVESLK